MFAGPIEPLEAPDVLTEPLWGLAGWGRAVHRLKLRKCGDDVGLTAEVLKHAPTEFWEHLLQCTMISFIMAQCPDRGFVLYSTCCLKRCGQNKLLDFRPIANIRLFYKVFACLVLDRIEHQLDDHQPEEQHGFRRGKRIEEHLLTANVFLDKALDVGIPVWVASLDLSKAFDRVHWPALWKGLLEQGISEHMIWMNFEIIRWAIWRGHRIDRSKQKIQHYRRCAARMCLSPRLFCAVLQFAMRKWRMKVGDLGFDLSDGMPHLIDLRFADDILLIARSAMEVRKLLDSLSGRVVGGGSSVECRQNCCFDNVKANRLQQSRLTME